VPRRLGLAARQTCNDAGLLSRAVRGESAGSVAASGERLNGILDAGPSCRSEPDQRRRIIPIALSSSSLSSRLSIDFMGSANPGSFGPTNSVGGSA